ncbi:hypothetical protein ACN6AX_00940 [Paenibacillus polymyxa]|uniref:hypothetical protein n=1 Tax=Paenibacillus polymyxa TaxID=1406 RepID=UPI00211D321A|nr:hypothetical protein [Paenibacillus polymyxa]
MVDQDIQKYLRCMEEVKARIEVIETQMLKTNVTILDIEFIYLQLRKIVELIMFSSIAANKNEYRKQYRDFRTHWNAKRILENLSKINPNFYPMPSRLGYNNKQQGIVEPVSEGYLMKNDLIKLNKWCGEILHATNPFRKEKDYKKYSKEVSNWVGKIVTLLNHHQVQLVDKDYELWIIMQEEQSGKVHYAIMKLVNKLCQS